MTDYPSDRLYTKDHEWALVDGELCQIGITTFAAKELGAVVFVGLPEVGRSVHRNDELGTIESVEVVSKIYAPVSGEIVEINETVQDDPENFNNDPLGDGWLVRIRILDKRELDVLLNAEQYADFINQMASGAE